jgi:hypothetical protein
MVLFDDIIHVSDLTDGDGRAALLVVALIEFHLNWFTISGHDLAPNTPHPRTT